MNLQGTTAMVTGTNRGFGGHLAQLRDRPIQAVSFELLADAQSTAIRAALSAGVAAFRVASQPSTPTSLTNRPHGAR